MATKAKSTTRSRTAKPANAATTKSARTVTKKTVVKAAQPVAAVRPVTRQKTYQLSNDLSGAQVIGEMIGTFLLVSVVVSTGGNAFLAGIALIAIVTALFTISGAHVNPAVTFGLFVMRKVSAVKMLFYWMAQFVGAIAAILAINAFASSPVNISLSSFMQWDWRVFTAELIGMSIFMFAIAAAAHRGQTDNDKALTIGLGLFVALLISGGLLQQAVTSASNSSQSGNTKESPRITKLSGTTVNPAVALSLSESSSNNAMATDTAKAQPSRLTIEVIVATLAGAALGGRLYLLLARNTEEGKL